MGIVPMAVRLWARSLHNNLCLSVRQQRWVLNPETYQVSLFFYVTLIHNVSRNLASSKGEIDGAWPR
jgi:hypothetical protein